jgi:hypothetical protein
VTELLDGDRIQASAARFLIDGGEEDAASVLLACRVEVWTSGDTWWVGDEQTEAVHVELTGPRAAYDALHRTTLLDQHDDYFGIPGQEREDAQRRPVFVEAAAESEFPPIVKPAIEKALEAVLPAGYYVKHLTVKAEMVDIDADWRQELLEIARGRGVTNQGVAIRDAPLYHWKNLRFRSKTEMKMAQALDRAGVLFWPNCMGRLGLGDRKRGNREADFLVCDGGHFGILEVDGEAFHPPSRAAEDQDRSRVFKKHGVRVVEHYGAERCWSDPDAIVSEFLSLLRA